jgi:hypothetical protein
MKQSYDNKSDAARVDLVTELDEMRPAERFENRSLSNVRRETVKLPDLGIEEVTADGRPELTNAKRG